MVRWFIVVYLLVPAFALPQTTDEDYKVYSDPPRLFLNAQRAKRIKRERERDSLRWRQFQTLEAGGANMPEPGFADALYYFVTGDTAAGKKAVDWAASASGVDIRQDAIVYDWCQAVMSPSQKAAILAKLKKAASLPAIPKSVAEARDKVLAATAIASDEPALAQTVNRQIVVDWFRGKIVASLNRGAGLANREEMHMLYELIHVVRDNTSIDLRDDAKEVFRELPVWHLLSHYPATYPAAENEYRIPVFSGDGEPDTKAATMSRAAELMMVALDNNALETQYMQGWLMQDRFLLRSTLGIPYEFLWANPYQPGLPYFKLNPFFHDRDRGVLLVRSTWEDDARWFGYFNGQIQLFEDGRVKKVQLSTFEKPFELGSSRIQVLKDAVAFKAGSEEGPSALFFLGLKPHEVLEVEIDEEEMEEAYADGGGIAVVQLPPQPPTEIRIRRIVPH